MSHNKLKTRNASLLRNTQPLFCFQNKLPFDLEKVTYVNQDRENQRQPLSLKNYLFTSKRITFFSSLAVTIFFP